MQDEGDILDGDDEDRGTEGTSEGTTDKRAAAEAKKPGQREKRRGCLGRAPWRAGRGQEDGEKGRSHHPPNHPGSNPGSFLNHPLPHAPSPIHQ